MKDLGGPGAVDMPCAVPWGKLIGFGGVAQLGERLVCNQEAIGSIPFTSTILRRKREGGQNG